MKKYVIPIIILPMFVILFIAIMFISVQGNIGIYQKIEQIYILFWIIFFLLLILLVIGLILFILFLLKVPIFRIEERNILEIQPEEIVRMSDSEKKDLLQKLQDKKRRVEYMIDLTKRRYYQREMDEESFREIVRDHQKKLIDIETKIKEMEEQIKKLKEQK